MDQVPFFQAEKIHKRFPGVLALDGVSMHVNAGEVLAIVGENGAGKSTLMKILSGLHKPDKGRLLIKGKEIHFAQVSDALKHGIVLIHQELNLAENLTISANIHLGRELNHFGVGWLSRSVEREQTKTLLNLVGLEASPDSLVSALSPGQKQLVEIARALSRSASVIIMDEPTSSLTQKETDKLYDVINDLRNSNVAIVYISHRLAEVKKIADRVTVLRDGKNAGELSKGEVSHDSLVRLMVGRDLKHMYSRGHVEKKDKFSIFEISNLVFRGGKFPVSFNIRGGEIVGMAGLVGAGRTELAEAIFGIRAVSSGKVLLDKKELPIKTPEKAIRAGILLIPEDRRYHGLILPFSIGENLSLPNYRRLCSFGWIIRKKVDKFCRQTIEKLKIKTFGPNQIAGLLSGGNQQKVVLGKWLAGNPRVLIFDEPTRGVDVGARSEIYALMDQLASQGVAILMISSDMEEVLGMSDRVLVMHEGKIAGELARGEITEQAIIHLATGGSI